MPCPAAALLQDGLCAVPAHPATVGQVVSHQTLRELDDARQELTAVRALGHQLLFNSPISILNLHFSVAIWHNC